MPIIEIDNLDNKGLAAYANLTEAQLRQSEEAKEGLFIAETPKVIGLALKMGCRPISFLMEQKRLQGQGKPFIDAYPQLPVYTGARDLLASLTGYRLTRGVLAAMERPKLPTLEQVLTGAKRVAVLEDIADSTNVGAIFRSAAALSIDAVLLSSTCCDPLCRRSVRVSMGTVFQVPWTYLPQGVEELQQWGFRTAAMALSDNSVSLEDKALAAEPKLALVFGTEGTGLRPETIRACDYTVKIPMAHNVDSLNVAAASAVAFWELRVR